MTKTIGDWIAGLLILIVVAYVGFLIFIEMTKVLWSLSPLTSIGFIISIIIAIWKGHISIDKLEDNLKILLFIFVGTIISYSAASLIPNLLDFTFSGDIVSAVIIGIVILAIWFRGQEIKNLSI